MKKSIAAGLMVLSTLSAISPSSQAAFQVSGGDASSIKKVNEGISLKAPLSKNDEAQGEKLALGVCAAAVAVGAYMVSGGKKEEEPNGQSEGKKDDTEPPVQEDTSEAETENLKNNQEAKHISIKDLLLASEPNKKGFFRTLGEKLCGLIFRKESSENEFENLFYNLNLVLCNIESANNNAAVEKVFMSFFQCYCNSLIMEILNETRPEILRDLIGIENNDGIESIGKFQVRCTRCWNDRFKSKISYKNYLQHICITLSNLAIVMCKGRLDENKSISLTTKQKVEKDGEQIQELREKFIKKVPVVGMLNK